MREHGWTGEADASAARALSAIDALLTRTAVAKRAAAGVGACPRDTDTCLADLLVPGPCVGPTTRTLTDWCAALAHARRVALMARVVQRDALRRAAAAQRDGADPRRHPADCGV